MSLAFVSTADYGLLPPLLRDFGVRHPRVRLELTEATSDVQVDELVAGRIDAGLVIAPLPPRHRRAAVVAADRARAAGDRDVDGNLPSG